MISGEFYYSLIINFTITDNLHFTTVNPKILRKNSFILHRKNIFGKFYNTTNSKKCLVTPLYDLREAL